MKKLTLCVLLCLLTTACHASKARPEVIDAHKATVAIAQKVVNSSNECSATVIGPQAILTAGHCELPSDELYVQGEFEPVQVHIKERLRDGLDHTIYLIEGTTFTHFAKVKQNDLQITEDVFMIGNPGPFNDFFRKGYFSGVQDEQATLADVFSGKPSKPPTLLFDMHVFHGDSGAAIFNSDGVVVEVLSGTFVTDKTDDPDYVFSLAYAYPMNFTEEQLKRAQTFTTPKDDSHGNKPSATTPNNNPASK
jgi:Trypsin-like peptidase domain